MKEENKKIIKTLFEEGESFTYENFSIKGDYGYPKTYTQNYISWRIRVKETLKNIFGEESTIFSVFKMGNEVTILGNNRDSFDKSQGYILGALKTAIDISDEKASVVSLKEEDPKLEFKKNNKVFIVHGHDESLKIQLEIFLKEIDLAPIILHREADEGQTIIEKFEKNSDVGYAFILLTPDDIGYNISEEVKGDGNRNKEHRARQNVIFEFGYFTGKLGRSKVCCLYKQDVEIPTDLSGIIYKKIINNVEEVGLSIIKDLNAAGYTIKFPKK